MYLKLVVPSHYYSSKIEQLPDTSGMKNEILIQKRHRYWYDRCLQLAGARLVEFGSEEQTTRVDLERAIGPNTAAVHYYAVEQAPDPKALSLEETQPINYRPILGPRSVYRPHQVRRWVHSGVARR